MDPTARFAAAVQRPEAGVALDEVAFLIAAHAYPGLDVAAECGRLDDLAASCPADTVDSVAHHLFVDLGFGGNVDEYYDPRNSYLNDVVQRRAGIPITLAIVMMEVGRRLDVPVVGVSMPGHFLVRSGADTDAFFDPFSAGARLDGEGVRARFRDLHGEAAPWDDSFVAPVGAHAVTARVLANLKAIFRATRDRSSLTWVLRLRSLVPGIPVDERRELASVLAADGRFDEAAQELDDAAADAGDAGTEELRAAAIRFRARLN